MIWICKYCRCVHGWQDHPKVMKVVSHQRYADCDVWNCPQCNALLDTRSPNGYIEMTLEEWENGSHEPVCVEMYGGELVFYKTFKNGDDNEH